MNLRCDNCKLLLAIGDAGKWTAAHCFSIRVRDIAKRVTSGDERAGDRVALLVPAADEAVAIRHPVATDEGLVLVKAFAVRFDLCHGLYRRDIASKRFSCSAIVGVGEFRFWHCGGGLKRKWPAGLLNRASRELVMQERCSNLNCPRY